MTSFIRLLQPRSSVLLALATALSASACDLWMTQAHFYSTVHVLVTKKSGAGIPNLPLVLYTGTRLMGYGTTDPQGRYDFTDVPEGLYGIYTSVSPGFTAVQYRGGAAWGGLIDNLQVNNNRLPPVHFTFIGPGTVVARVSRENGAALAGVPVSLYKGDSLAGSAKTDTAGKAVFERVPFGTYRLVAERPLFYSDFVVPGDSAYAVRDSVHVDEDVRDSVAIRLPRCAGAVNVLVQDNNSAPVPGTSETLYSSRGDVATAVSGADGRAVLPAPCAISLGVRITPPAGYSVASGAGSSFVDGLTVTNGGSTDVVFHVVKAP